MGELRASGCWAPREPTGLSPRVSTARYANEISDRHRSHSKRETQQGERGSRLGVWVVRAGPHKVVVAPLVRKKKISLTRDGQDTTPTKVPGIRPLDQESHYLIIIRDWRRIS